MNEIEKIFNKGREAMYDELIEKHIEPLQKTLSKASVEYFFAPILYS